jgi:hypothetical protein
MPPALLVLLPDRATVARPASHVTIARHSARVGSPTIPPWNARPRALLPLALAPQPFHRGTPRASLDPNHRPHILTEIGLPDSLSKPSLATRRHPCESVISVWERESLWSQS